MNAQRKSLGKKGNMLCIVSGIVISNKLETKETIPETVKKILLFLVYGIISSNISVIVTG